MENLGKENFWNEMERLYPKAVDVFKKWIDGYKRRVGWVEQFGPSVKFHDLPYELQMGIMNRFFIETYAGEKEYINNCQGRYREETVHSLRQLNDRLNPVSGVN